MSQKTELSILLLSGPEQGKRLHVEEGGELIAGRSKETDLVVNDNRASRHHARFFSLKGALYVEDLNSRNGTFVNGELVSKQALFPGDIIEIRNLRIQIQAGIGQGEGGLDGHSGFGDSGVATMANALISPVGKGKLDAMLEFVLRQNKTGAVVLRAPWDTGKIFIKNGIIYHAALEKKPNLHPKKALERLYRARSGTPEFNTGGEVEAPEALKTGLQRPGDSDEEYEEALFRLEKKMPVPDAKIVWAEDGIQNKPVKMPSGMDELISEKLPLPLLLDRFPGTDLECIQCLNDLIAVAAIRFQR